MGQVETARVEEVIERVLANLNSLMPRAKDGSISCVDASLEGLDIRLGGPLGCELGFKQECWKVGFGPSFGWIKGLSLLLV